MDQRVHLFRAPVSSHMPFTKHLRICVSNCRTLGGHMSVDTGSILRRFRHRRNCSAGPAVSLSTMHLELTSLAVRCPSSAFVGTSLGATACTIAPILSISPTSSTLASMGSLKGALVQQCRSKIAARPRAPPMSIGMWMDVSYSVVALASRAFSTLHTLLTPTRWVSVLSALEAEKDRSQQTIHVYCARARSLSSNAMGPVHANVIMATEHVISYLFRQCQLIMRPVGGL